MVLSFVLVELNGRWTVLVLAGWYFLFLVFFFFFFVLEYGMVVSPKTIPFWDHSCLLKYSLRSCYFWLDWNSVREPCMACRSSEQQPLLGARCSQTWGVAAGRGSRTTSSPC